MYSICNIYYKLIYVSNLHRLNKNMEAVKLVSISSAEEKEARKVFADWQKACHITTKLHEAILQLSKTHSNLRINAVMSDESDSSVVYEINEIAEVIKDLEALENEADTISKTLFNTMNNHREIVEALGLFGDDE